MSFPLRDRQRVMPPWTEKCQLSDEFCSRRQFLSVLLIRQAIGKYRREEHQCTKEAKTLKKAEKHCRAATTRDYVSRSHSRIHSLALASARICVHTQQRLLVLQVNSAVYKLLLSIGLPMHRVLLPFLFSLLHSLHTKIRLNHSLSPFRICTLLHFF